MIRFLQSRTVRAWVAVIFGLSVLLTGVFHMAEQYGRLNDWYYLSHGAGFEATEACRDFVRSGNYYVERNVRWLEDTTLEGLGSYAGRAYAYVIRDGDGRVTADTRTEDSVFVSESGDFTLSSGASFTVEGYVNLPVEPYDGCYREYAVFELLFPLRYLSIVFKVLFILLALLSSLALIAGAAVRGRTLGLPAALEKPFDAIFLADLAGYAIMRLLLHIVYSAVRNNMEYGFYYYENIFFMWWAEMGYSVLCAAVLCFALAFALWYMAGQIGAKSLVRRLFLRRLPPSLVIAVFAAVHLTLVLIATAYTRMVFDGGEYMPFYISYSTIRTVSLILVLIDIALVPLLILYTRDARRVSRAAEELAGGDLACKTDVGRLHFVWRELGERLNGIGDGMSQAVEDRMKSERMKTELITNVSHDLKTPLTSIINYGGLLKSADLTEEQRSEYLDILDRQSQKLKKLTEDVVEASKAASGVITAELEPIDAGELLEQFLGEFSGRLETARVEPILTAPEGASLVLADSALLGRVIENLLTNVVKYAQPGTRAYFTLAQTGEKTLVTVKNTSREMLNISADELMERFVRGDSSRHSEGSGLGLSIAKSLTELMGGTLTLTLDGDLFKAEVALDSAG